MKLDIGNEKRFFDFIKNLNEKDKIALISHTDMDGLASAYVVKAVIDPNIIKFAGYEELNENLISELKKEKINKVILTDLCINQEQFLIELQKTAEILIIDHHIPLKDWNSEKITFIKGEDGYSAGYLCYELFSKITNLDYADWIVACSCISDYCHKKPADWLKKIFEKYGDTLEMENGYVRKSGQFWTIQLNLSLALIYFKENINKVFDSIGKSFGDIGEMSNYAETVQKEIDLWVAKFKKEKIEFPDGYFYEISPKFKLGSIISTIISQDYKNKTCVILTHRDQGYTVSFRRQDKQKNMSEMLRSILKDIPNSDGGGHIPAAGGHFPEEYIGEFKKRLGVKA